MLPAHRLACDVTGCTYQTKAATNEINQTLTKLKLHIEMRHHINEQNTANVETIMKPMLVPTYGSQINLKGLYQKNERLEQSYKFNDKQPETTTSGKMFSKK